MPILAIAGGTSASLGRAITTSLLQNTKQWNAVILSRTTRAPTWLRAVDPDSKRTQIRKVDYMSIESLHAALKDVDTVVSVTSAVDGTQPQIQKNLLHAAVQAGCKRFAPSQWGFGPKGWENVKSLKWASDGVWEECLAQKDKIECTRFNQGVFMNYIGHGIYPVSSQVDKDASLEMMKAGGGYMAGEDDACQGLLRQGDLKDGSGAFLMGLKNGIAEFPKKDDGSWPRVTLTSLKDVGRFVVASLDLPSGRWEENMTMVGETLTMGELLAHAEAVTGRKFEVSAVTQADLEKKIARLSEDDFMARMWTEFKLAYIRDLDDEVVLKPVMNQLCPDLKPMGVREYMETFFHGK
ncbi:NmrA-like family protein [Aaosphaeria arxii CBS 175.79]|uniref:NmrA-like family protein n=1 Tax=Aaosphaeria arxii CBS 175.79 TaxID=1450172 RepID=A0A6A5XI01_9PLEO|nr:NmrA-like family protein [Aaosphaeria arxii CBS 175.79]KAF2012742.1 NmrA-like family protein [Aaosphaeria arxii CBS 175.79]